MRKSRERESTSNGPPLDEPSSGGVSKFLGRLFTRDKNENNPKVTFERLFPDRDGTFETLLKHMQIGGYEKNRWFKIWMQLTKDNDYKLNLQDFQDHFKLDRSIWIDRIFDIMNYNLSGKTTFEEFVNFCSSYILIDKDSTIELCFRLLSRRGTNFMKEFSVLDVDDMKNFLTERYTIKGYGKLKKRGQDVLTGIALSAEMKEVDGAILLGDFVKFCRLNPVFVRFTHRIQTHIRNCLFGMSYWVDRSRKIKAAATGSMFTLTITANLASERYIADQLFDAEADLDQKDRKKRKKKDRKHVNRTASASEGESDGATKLPRIKRASLGSGGEGKKGSKEEKKGNKEEKKGNKEEKKGKEDPVYDRKKSMILDNGELKTKKKSPNEFGADFPEAEMVRGKRRAAAIAKLELLRNVTSGDIAEVDGVELEDEDEWDEEAGEDGVDRCIKLDSINVSQSIKCENIEGVDGGKENVSVNIGGSRDDTVKSVQNDSEGGTTSRPDSRTGSRPSSRMSTRPTSVKIDIAERKMRNSKCVLHPSVYAAIKAEDDANREREHDSSFDRYLQSYTDNLHHPRNILHADRARFLPMILRAANNSYI